MLPVTLIYHRISGEAAAQADPFTVTPERFRAQMARLARWGYAGVGLGAALAGGAAGRRVALTFDDGTDDFFNMVWPELRARGWGATALVVTGRVGATADWDGPRGARLMAWEQLRRLRAEGAEIGAHAHQHRALDLLPPDEARADLAAAYAALAREVGPPEGVAYPYGRGGRAVAQAAQAAGFAWGATARGGRGRRDGSPYLLRRTQVRGDDGPLRFWIKVTTGYARWVEWRMDVKRMKDEGSGGEGAKTNDEGRKTDGGTSDVLIN